MKSAQRADVDDAFYELMVYENIECIIEKYQKIQGAQILSDNLKS